MPTQEMGNRGGREVNIGKTFRTRGRRGKRRIDREKGTEAMETPSNLREEGTRRTLGRCSSIPQRPVSAVSKSGIFQKTQVFPCCDRYSPGTFL
jgi:hypothetical protein